MKYGYEGFDFYTCGEYSLCVKCNLLKKPCHDYPDKMQEERLLKIANEKKHEVEIEQSLNDFTDESGYWE